VQLLSYWPLLWLVGVILLALALRYTLVDRPRMLRVASTVFRALSIALLAIALCQPFLAFPSRRLHTAFLLDVSQSVDLAAAQAAIPQVDDAIAALHPTDSFSVFALGDGIRQFESTAELRECLAGWANGLSDERFRSATRLGDALRAVRFVLPAGRAHRIVVFSDARPTDGSTRQAIDLLHAEHASVRYAPLAGLNKPEAAVVELVPATPTAFEHEMIRLTARLCTNTPMPATLRLVQRGVVIIQTDVQLTPEHDNHVAFDVPADIAGPTVWTAELTPESDQYAINNRVSCIVTVRGQPRVLILHREPRDMRSIARALQQQGFSVDLRGARGLPEHLTELLAFDAIVLADVAAMELSTSQMLMLQRYVADSGGGLMMMGSENSFGLGGYYKTPVEQVLPLVSRFEKEKEKPSLAMVLVIDKSGSMDGLPIALARQAAKATAELLSMRDQIGVVAFDSQAYIVSEMRSAADIESTKAAIDGLGAGGGTYMYSGMATARELLDIAPAKIKHMIVLSDGQTQPADHDGLVADLVDMNVTVSTVALGPQADQQLLSRLAEAGQGRYYQTLDPSTVPQIFTRETMHASRSAIKEDLFASVQVTDHPLLSDYEHTQLPYILGYVMTQPKPTAQVILATETGDPLLAIARYGLGIGMAFTSDLTDRWGGEWLAWEGCGRFWAQAFRSLVREPTSPGLEARGEAYNDAWHIDIGRCDEADQPIDDIEWKAQVISDDGKVESVAVQQVGLGRYQALVPLNGRARLTLCLHDTTHDLAKVMHYQRPYPAEYQLRQRVDPDLVGLPPFDARLIRNNVPPTVRRSSATPPFVWAAIACLLLGLLLRRV